jgi:protein O-mannosyl-transferase
MNNTIKTKFAIAISVSVVTFIVFLPSLKNEFVWDDVQYVYSNSFIRSLDTQLLKSALVEFHEANWHPLTWLSHAFDYVIWGLNPLGHHLTNNIFHALNTIIVVFLVIRLMEDFNKTAGNKGLSRPFLDDRTIRITGAATGLLFGLHPLHVESVAWVAERKDLLCAFFFLLTIMMYTHYVSEMSARNSINSASRFFNKKYLFTLGLFTLSLLSKPMAVSLPVVLLILDWYLFKRIQTLKTFWTAFNEKLPFITLSLISSILTILAQEASGAIASVDAVPLTSRMMMAAQTLIVYLEKILLPLNLLPYYPYPERISLFSSEYIIPIVIVIAITVTCILVVRKQQLWLSVWSYYFITLIPVLGIVQVGGQSMADRYTYLPSLGPLFIIGLLLAKVYEKVTVIKGWESIAKTAAYLVAVVMLATISFITIKQIGIWKNSDIFWSYIVDKGVTRVPVVHYNLGLAFASKGDFDRAIEQYQAALKLRWDFVDAYYDLGLAFASKGDFDRAIEQYQAALRLKPDYLEAYNNLGLAFASKGNYDRAIEQYQAALKLKPDYAAAYNNLGLAFASNGNYDKAIEQYQAALSLQPNLAETHFNLGWSYLKKGNKEMARREFEVGLTIKPDVYSARQTLNSIISK